MKWSINHIKDQNLINNGTFAIMHQSIIHQLFNEFFTIYSQNNLVFY